ncbi:hypothetical protein RJ640_008144 [Escallonia rubra]|uniref:Uncharacterized protein n=1 Tax=Escallonia rubra TaxID=112253 RepID=A0AA88RHM2_9ASTE|nr:hypothetical protein RJ640_008144 [Escallonia rubra]
MSYLSRAWVAASVAVVNGNTDKGHKLRSGLKSLQHGKKRFSSSTSTAGEGIDPADLRPLSSMLGSDVTGAVGNGSERRRQADDSLRQMDERGKAACGLRSDQTESGRADAVSRSND